MTKRRKFFRGVQVRLECGHTKILPSDAWRITDAYASILVGAAMRGGTWCHECEHGGMAMPVAFLGTIRLDEAAR